MTKAKRYRRANRVQASATTYSRRLRSNTDQPAVAATAITKTVRACTQSRVLSPLPEAGGFIRWDGTESQVATVVSMGRKSTIGMKNSPKYEATNRNAKRA